MLTVSITEEGGQQRRLEFGKNEITIGRVQGNDIILAKRNVSKQHARILFNDGQATVMDLNSTNGTWVNGRKITAPLAIAGGDKVHIADFLIQVEQSEAPAAHPTTAAIPSPEPASPEPDASAVPDTRFPEPPAAQSQNHPHVPSSAPVRHVQAQPEPVRPVRSEPEAPKHAPAAPAPAESVAPQHAPPAAAPSAPDVASSTSGESLDPGGAQGPLGALMARLSERFDIHDLTVSSMRDQTHWSAAQSAIAETLEAMQEDGSLQSGVDTRQLSQAALHEAAGLGALDEVLSNKSVREIVASGPNSVQVDTGNGLKPSSLRFSSCAAMQTIARRLAADAGHELGDQQVFHGALSFGPQISITRSPLAVNGPIIEIRMTRTWTLEECVETGWFDDTVRERLEQAVDERENVVVLGPVGAGVTALLSAVAGVLPKNERVVAVEVVPDLQVDRERVASLVTTDNRTLRDVLRHATQLRAERLIVDDLTNTDMLEALSTVSARERGHLLGAHVTGEDAVQALVTAVGLGGANEGAAAALVASGVDLVVSLGTGHGTHQVTGLYEIDGLHDGAPHVRRLL